MGKTIAVVSQKGGVGKTTLAANLAAAMGALGFRTLLVEGDPQGSLVGLFGLDRFDLHRGLFGCLHEGRPASESLETAVAARVDLLPANVWSHDEERSYLEIVAGNPLGLRTLLADIRGDYDYLVVDAPPALGPMTRAVLAAAQSYVVPVQAEALNLATLPRLRVLADEVRSLLNPELRFEGYVITMADTRTRHAQEVIGELAAAHPRDLLQTVIPRSVRVAEEARRGRPTLLSRPQSPVGRAYERLAEEILSRDARERAASGTSDVAGEPGAATGDPSWREEPDGITAEEIQAVREFLRNQSRTGNGTAREPG